MVYEKDKIKSLFEYKVPKNLDLLVNETIPVLINNSTSISNCHFIIS